MARKSKKKFRIIMSSVLTLVLLVGVAGNVALAYFSDVITSYFTEIDIESAESVEARADSEELGEQIADEGIVLLQNNENALPIDTSDNAKVNVFGWSFTNPIYGGTGSGGTDTTTAVTPRLALENAGFEINEQLYNDYVDTGIERPIVGMDGQDWTIPEPVTSDFYTDERMQQAKDFSNTAIVFIARSGGEGADLPRSIDGPDTFDPEGSPQGPTGQRFGNEDDLDASKHYLELSNREQGMIDAVTENFDEVILVVNSANTFELGWVDEYSQIKSVVNVAGPGQTGFNSLGKILAGDVNPSGRTVDIYASDLLDAPAMKSYGDLDYVIDNGDGTYSQAFDSSHVPLKYVDYVEGIYVGYRYYETAAQEGVIDYDDAVVYPFGYGLSFTTFDQNVVEDSLDWGDEEISVDVEVTNTGSVAGKEVVQLYVSAPYTGEIEKSAVELVAFEKTPMIEPGESETVTLSLQVEDLASYDANKAYSDTGSYVLEAGEYTLSLMKNSHEKIDDVATKELSEIVYDEEGRASDEQVAVNQFDDVTGLGSISTYLTRADGFAGLESLDQSEEFTVVTEDGNEKTVRGKLIEDELVDLINSNRYDVAADSQDAPPTTGADNGLELKDLTGVSYDDEKWNDLLDQLSVNEMVELVTLGGYRTIEVASVGKPATLDYDGPAGISNFISGNPLSGIAQPTEVMIASTWNLDLAEEMGDRVGAEASAYGVTGWYAPGVNIHRTAFSGRNFEYYSEDAFLSGKMGAAVTKGFQDHGGYVYLKHYALNDQETNRTFALLTWSNEQAIREIYLKAFEIPVKEGGAKALMSAFNSIGPLWAGADEGLLKEVLRNEWGFNGHVITDFFMNGGGLNAYPYMNVEHAIRSGNDLMLTGVAPVGVPEVNTSSNDTLWALRDSAHNILYTAANSETVDLSMSSDMPQWVKITMIVDILLALGIIAGFYYTFRKPKESSQEEKIA